MSTDGTPFGARLHAAMAARGPFCAGIDPHASLLSAWGSATRSRGCAGSR